MLKDYSSDPKLFERNITLIDSIFPGLKEVAYQGVKYHAAWPDVSVPFITEEKDEIIAHLGIIGLQVILHHMPHIAAAIHGVCVKPEYRRKGLFKKLMVEALEYSKQHFDSSLLFTDQPDLYYPFGFRILPEWDFIVKTEITKSQYSCLKRLKFDNSNDLEIVHNLLSNCEPLSNHFNVNEKVLFVLNALDKNICYSEEFNTIIVYQIEGNTLYLQDMLFQEAPKINHILSLIKEPFEKAVLQFCPDKFIDCEYTPVEAKPECHVMVTDSFVFKGEFFRYPETYRC